MGKIKAHGPIKLIVGLITNNDTFFNMTASILIKRFGKMDYESENMSFNHTTYYEEEMGRNMRRKFLSFHRLINNPEGVEKIKIFTNAIEKKFSTFGKRAINIDPGYITADKVVLLTTKNYSHRMYLRNGIYAEVTLFFKNNSFQPWQWTYPDYKTDPYINIFNRIRDIYVDQLRTIND